MTRKLAIFALLLAAALYGDVRAQQVPGQLPGCGPNISFGAVPGAQVPSGCGAELPNNPNNSVVTAPCGTGVIDLSTGCSIAIPLGLVP